MKALMVVRTAMVDKLGLVSRNHMLVERLEYNSMAAGMYFAENKDSLELRAP